MTKESLNILIVEDDEDDIYLVKNLLSQDKKSKYVFENCGSLAEIKQVAEKKDFDLVLLDLGLTDSEGIDTLTKFMNYSLEVPVVVLTGIDSDEIGELAIKYGAEDYVPKAEMDTRLIIRAAKYAIERNRLHEKIKKQAEQDPLTKIPNRTIFFEKLESLIQQSCRNQMTIALAMIDLDDFKPINDKYGHIAGDKLLTEFAQRLQDSIRITDAVARFGGDEFSMLITNYKDKEELVELINRKHESLMQPYNITSDEKTIELSIGVSIGVIEWRPELSINDITRMADEALYQSKSNGKNQVYYSDNS